MFNKIKNFVDNLMTGKNKIETKIGNDTNSINLSPPRCQGALMMHTGTIRDIIIEMLEKKEYKYSEEEMVVLFKFTGKNGKLYYKQSIGRDMDAYIDDGSYSSHLTFIAGDKYEITLTLAVYMKNRYKDGKDRACAFCKTALEKFVNQADM